MGGINEKTLTPPSAQAGHSLGIGAKIRLHENKGEVHLHDDNASKKFACPVADFYSAWKSGKANNFSTDLVIIGHDGNNNPLAAKFERAIIGGKVDVTISFEPISFGSTVSQIDDFIAGK